MTCVDQFTWQLEKITSIKELPITASKNIKISLCCSESGDQLAE